MNHNRCGRRQDSPHGVKVIIWGHVILIITRQAQLVPVALMYKVPQLFGAQRLLGKEKGKNMRR